MAASGKGVDGPAGRGRRAASAETLAPVLAKGRRTSEESVLLEEYLRRQSELLALEIQDHHDLQDLEIAHLRVRRWRDRLEVAVMASVAVFAVALVIALGAMVWQAAGSRDVVVDTFSVPPALAATGMNGEVVAKRLLDKVDAMQRTSNSTLENAAAYRRAGEDPIRIAIPAAGISVGDLDRYLHRWLGHETHISGEIISTAAGLQAVARYGDRSAVVATGADPDAALSKVAEGLFAQTRPLRYADFLINTGRFAEAEAALLRLAASGAAHERALALAGWANVRISQGDVSGAWERARAAVDTDPDSAIAQAWYASIAYMSGRLQPTLSGATAAVRQSRQGGSGPGSKLLSDTSRLYFGETAQEMSGDFAGAVESWRKILASASIDTLSASQSIGQRAGVYAQVHDTATARRIADQMPLRDGDGRPRWSGASPRVAVSVAAKDWSGALSVGDPAIAATAGQPGVTTFVQTFLRPGLAIAHAEAGDLVGAESVIGPTPLTCDPCVIARGRIAALKGDPTASDRWFAIAAANSPSTPFADTAWGEALLARGQTDAAIAKLAAAHRVGPRYADALEIWGEALARKGAFEEASAKFAEAATYAPRWGRLHLKWGEALAGAGKRDEARGKFKAAAGMEMSAAERQELRGQAA
jgi:tetratricopeptide (TPR) repeat protein